MKRMNSAAISARHRTTRVLIAVGLFIAAIGLTWGPPVEDLDVEPGTISGPAVTLSVHNPNSFPVGGTIWADLVLAGQGTVRVEQGGAFPANATVQLTFVAGANIEALAGYGFELSGS